MGDGHNRRVSASPGFWTALDRLVEESTIVIDRPRGSVHSRYPALVYPLDYGHLEQTRSGDMAAVDVWTGTGGDSKVTAIIATVDLEKRDVEVKLLLGCTPTEAGTILAVHSSGGQAAVLVERGEE